jgi:acetylornithine deacetylase/succinyl-diaminopimelate desuccinylase-like protein
MRLISLTILSMVFASHLLAQTRQWRMAHEREIVSEFATLLALPNLADDAANIERNATALKVMLERRGVTVKVLTLDGAPPIVVGDLRAPGASRTISFYAHYDGQPVDESQWSSPPWTPVMRDQAVAAHSSSRRRGSISPCMVP